eukprot:4416826-Pyramimonas_sp.AAC.1
MSEAVCVFCPNTLRFRSRFGGCFERGAHFHVPKVSRRGVMHGPVRGRFVGMSQTVCLPSVPASFAFGADLELSLIHI